MPLLFLVGLLVSLTTIFFIYQRKSYPQIAPLKSLTGPESQYEFVSSTELRQVLEHPETMQKVGESFLENKVKSIYLVHGTFVGEDPFHVASIIERSFPKLRPELVESIRKKIKKGQDLLAKDIGNFVPEHIEYLSKFISSNVYNFSWSSGNHHYARVEGCIRLIEDLTQKHGKGDRVLLIGHSHAGQIFAVLTQLLFNPEFRDYVQLLFPATKLLENLAVIQNMKLDIVTLGTPARYPWFLSDNMQLLHIINHRGTDLFGGGYRDSIFTGKGDYIQQWGVSGSDMNPAQVEIKQINKKLERFLGAGSNLNILRRKIALKRRLHTDGMHLLVDYDDAGKLPNFVLTIFGHGSYTRLKFLPFLLNSICKKIYH